MKYTIPANATEVEILDPVFTVNNPPVNQPPTADAGSDFAITLPTNTVRLLGRGSDPEGSAVSFLWTKVSGPAASIVSPNSANTDVAGLVEGNYVFRLTVTDDKGATKTDDVAGVVKPAIVVVPPPVGNYEGFGSQAVGGSKSSVVYHVTNLNSSGAGSLAAGIGSNKTIVFDVSGIIYGTRIDLLNISYLTIDANGHDVTLDNHTANGGVGPGGDILSIDQGSHHVIIIGIRTINAGNDGINVINGANNVLIDHCSSYDCSDGNIDIAGAKYVTVQYSLMGRGKAGWGGDMLITSEFISAHHNLYVPATSGVEGERCPLVHCNYSPVADPNADFRNNVVMNFGRSGGTGSGYGTAVAYKAHANVVNNFYHDKESAASAICIDDGYGNGATGQVFSAGNYITNGSIVLSPTMANNHAEFPIPDINKITMDTAQDAAKKVKASVGTAVKNSYEQGLINAIPV